MTRSRWAWFSHDADTLPPGSAWLALYARAARGRAVRGRAAVVVVVDQAGPVVVTGPVPLDARPSGRRWCVCVSTHSPTQLDDEAEGHHVWPLGEGGPDVVGNLRWLCPSTHTKAHNLWRAFERAERDGQTAPAWEIMRRYSPYVREIVAEGWGQAHGARTIPIESPTRRPLEGTS